MPLDPSFVGRAFASSEPYLVGREKIREFAAALGDGNPACTSVEAARALGYPDLVAPPTFAITFRDEQADTGSLLRDLGTDVSRLLHGEQEFEIFRQLRPGETYLCRSTVVEQYEKTGKSGPMGFVVRETTVTDHENEIVAKARGITVVRL